jgi:hypothetical protein
MEAVFSFTLWPLFSQRNITRYPLDSHMIHRRWGLWEEEEISPLPGGEARLYRFQFCSFLTIPRQLFWLSAFKFNEKFCAVPPVDQCPQLFV